jgi:hypothetical protein
MANEQLHQMMLKVWQAIDDLPEDYSRSLEEYLLTVWSLLQECRGSEPTCEQFAHLLTAGLKQPPSSFRREWLESKKEPQWRNRSLPDLMALEDTVLFQIADLRRIAESDEKFLPYSSTAPTGQTWNNLDVLMYLEGAMNLKANTNLIKQEFSEEPSWRSLATILELGRLYE